MAGGGFPSDRSTGDIFFVAVRYRERAHFGLGGLSYVGFVSQYLAFFVFNAAMAIGGIARIGQVMLLQPFVIVALASPVNGEPIDIETIVFATAVVAVVLVGQRMRVSRR